MKKVILTILSIVFFGVVVKPSQALLIDNGDGTITDTQSELQWLKKANCILTDNPSFDTDFSVSGAVTWQHAQDFIDGLNTGDYSCDTTFRDWRLPSLKELHSLNYPEMHLFSNLPSNTLYWSSTVTSGFLTPENAWGEHINRSWWGFRSKEELSYVLPVRGTPLPPSTFTDNGDGTVTENSSGLIWLKDATCLGKTNWDNAVSVVSNLAHGQCGLSDGSVPGDWHLPDTKEFGYLMDLRFNYPALSDADGIEKWSEGDIFTGIDPNWYYWSSVPVLPEPSTNVYLWYSHHGDLHQENKSNENYFWPVRNTNGTPTAEAGPDQIAFDTITLDGSKSSDPDEDPLIYQWQIQHTVNPAYNRTASGEIAVVTDLQLGFYNVTMTVTDPGGATDTDTMFFSATGLKGDFDFDGDVDAVDLGSFIENYGAVAE